MNVMTPAKERFLREVYTVADSPFEVRDALLRLSGRPIPPTANEVKREILRHRERRSRGSANDGAADE